MFYTQEFLLETFFYEPSSGFLYWKSTGKRAGSLKYKKNGEPNCRRVTINKVGCKEHHVIWCMVYGYWPEFIVDHADGDPFCNKILNIRPATKSQNGFNKKVRCDSSSGLKGVQLRRGRWVARIKGDGKRLHLGSFDTKEAAHAAYCAAARKLHGRFARFS